MFELGLDQAHGLKQMFMPLSNGRINVIGVCPDRDIAAAAIAVGTALTSRGFDVQWQDPDRLLPANRPQASSPDGAQIIVAASRESTDAFADDPVPDYSIFASNPHPDQLTDLYKAMKSATSDSDADTEQPPFTVLWCGEDDDYQRLQHVCEANLTEAVERFLFREVEYINASLDQQSRSLVSQHNFESGAMSHGFIERVSAKLLTRLGQISQSGAASLN
jgi:hypothetical protein